jgi:hypothetical protein
MARSKGLHDLWAEIVLADDPVAADATCARLMGCEPMRIVHIREARAFLGTLTQSTSTSSRNHHASRDPVQRDFRICETLCLLTPERRRRSENSPVDEECGLEPAT